MHYNSLLLGRYTQDHPMFFLVCASLLFTVSLVYSRLSSVILFSRVYPVAFLIPLTFVHTHSVIPIALRPIWFFAAYLHTLHFHLIITLNISAPFLPSIKKMHLTKNRSFLVRLLTNLSDTHTQTTNDKSFHLFDQLSIDLSHTHIHIQLVLEPFI